MKAARGVLALVAVVLLPLLLGYLVVGPRTPVGRNGDSVTGIGHKAFRLLLRGEGHDVLLFGRGVEALPPLGRSALVALEPGPLLLREDGAHAGPLLRWVEAGNGALLTLGPDPDRAAETDDRAQIFGAEAGRAIAAAKALEAEARARRADAGGENAEAEAKGSGEAHPTEAEVQVGVRLSEDESWPTSRLGRWLGLPLADQRLVARTATAGAVLTGPLAAALGQGPRLLLTRPRVFAPLARTSSVTVLLYADGQPLVLSVSRGKGRLVLLAEPRLLQNGAIGRGIHARLGVALVESLGLPAGPKAVWWEEWSHGRGDAEGLGALIAGTALKWWLLQLLVIGSIWAWAVAPARRRPVPEEVPPRRSKAEAIQATATLQLRTGDWAGAIAALHGLTHRAVGRAVSGGRPIPEPQVMAAAAQRLGRSVAELERLFQAIPATPRAFVERARALRELRLSVEGRSRPGPSSSTGRLDGGPDPGD